MSERAPIPARQCETEGCSRTVKGRALFCGNCVRLRAAASKRRSRGRAAGNEGAPPPQPGRVWKPGPDDQPSLFGQTENGKRRAARSHRNRAIETRVSEIMDEFRDFLGDADRITVRELAEAEHRRDVAREAALADPTRPDAQLMRVADAAARHILSLHAALGITPAARGKTTPGWKPEKPPAETPVDVEPSIYDEGAFGEDGPIQ